LLLNELLQLFHVGANFRAHRVVRVFEVDQSGTDVGQVRGTSFSTPTANVPNVPNNTVAIGQSMSVLLAF
jgi:hypothetical protein